MPYSFDEVRSVAYLTRRQSLLARAPDLTASMRFDLASSPLTDDELDEVSTEFGADPQDQGFGIAEVMREYLSRKEQTVPVGDLRLLQEHLKEEGYAPPGFEPTGQWDPASQGMLSRYERDARDLQRSGKHLGAMPAMEALMWLGHTLPRGVWQGVVGTAKGVVGQAGETAENLGLLGGAAAGAALGSVVPGVGTAAGALVGGIAGGVTGFLADLFGEDEEETESTNHFLDALTPFEEYTGPEGGAQFLDDLATIGSAASMLWGAGAAVKGVRAGFGFAKNVRSGLAAAPEGAASMTVPGVTGAPTQVLTGGLAGTQTSLLRASLMKVPVERPGWFFRLAGAAEKGFRGAGSTSRLVEWARVHSIWAQTQRPAMQTLVGGFTGLSKGQFGARVGQALLSPGRESDLEKAIRTTQTPPFVDVPFLPTINAFGIPIDLGYLADPLDMAGFWLWPKGFLPDPVTLRGLGRAADKLTGPDRMRAYSLLAGPVRDEAGKIVRWRGARESYEYAKEMLVREGDVEGLAFMEHTDLTHGLNRVVAREVADLDIPSDLGRFQEYHVRLRNRIREVNAWRDAIPVRKAAVDSYGGNQTSVPRWFEDGPEFDRFADELLDKAVDQGGFSYRLHERRYDSGDDGFWVGIGENYGSPDQVLTRGKVTAAEVAGTSTRKLEVTPEMRAQFHSDLKNFRERYRPYLERDQVLIGGFVGDEGVYLDPTLVVGTKADAVKAAEAYGQWGITARKDFAETKTWKQAQKVARGQQVVKDAMGFNRDSRLRPDGGPLAKAAWMMDVVGLDSVDRIPGFIRAQRLRARLQDMLLSGRLAAKAVDEPGKFATVSAGKGKVRVAVTKPRMTEEVNALLRERDEMERLLAQNTAARRGANNAQGHVALKKERDLIEAELERIAENIRSARKVRDPKTVDYTLAFARQETWTRSDYIRRADEMDAILTERKALLKADQPNTARLAELDTRWREVIDEAVQAEALPQGLERMVARARERPNARPVTELRERAELVARDAILPDEQMAAFAAEGYKPVFTGEDILWPDQQVKFGESVGIPEYSRTRAVIDTLGLSPRWQSDQSIWKLRVAHERAELQQVLDQHGVPYRAATIHQKLHARLEEMNHEGAVVGSVIFPKGKGIKDAHLFRMDLRELSVDDIVEALNDVPGFSAEVAEDILPALKRGAAYGAEASLKHPLQTMKSIGRAIRVNGLPGFVDVMRTARQTDPGRVARDAQNARVRLDAQLHEPGLEGLVSRRRTADRLRTAFKERHGGLREEQADVAMLLLDQSGRRAVEAGRYASMDEYYKALDLQFSRGVPDADDLTGYLHQVVTRETRQLTPEQWGEYMKFAADPLNIEYGKRWYTEGRAAVQRTFRGRTELADGKVIADSDLMTQLLSITSVQRDPSANMTLALRAFRAIKGTDRTGLVNLLNDLAPKEVKAIRGMLLDLFEGRTIDTWKSFQVRSKVTGQRFLDVDAGDVAWFKEMGLSGAGKPLSVTAKGGAVTRPKVTAFYKALSGDPNVVVVDTRMKVMWGTEDAALIADDVHRMAEDLSKELGYAVTPSDVQASLWGSYQDVMEVKLRSIDEAIRRARADGNTILVEELTQDLDTLQVQAERYLENRNFKDLLKTPTAGAKTHIDYLVDRNLMLSPYALMNQVGNDIRGAFKYGPDYAATMRLFKTADLDTFIHENMHLVRRLLPDEEVAELAKHYGLAPEPTDPLKVAPTEFGPALKQDLPEGVELGKTPARALEKHVDDPVIRSRTQASLRHRGLPEEFVVFRAAPGPSAPDRPVGVSLDRGVALRFRKEGLPGGGLQAYRVRREDVLLDVEAFGVGLRESELLVRQGALKPVGGYRWTREAEESFARDAAAYIRERVQPPKPLSGPMQGVRLGMKGLWRALREDARTEFGADPFVRETLDGWFDFQPLREAANLPYLYSIRGVEKGTKMLGPGRLRMPLTGTALGAGAGAVYGDDPEDILQGALVGGAVGLGARRYARRNYGFMTDRLARLNSALRYTLSFTFDAGRYSEQNMIAAMKHGLPMMLAPRKYIAAREWKRSLSGEYPVRGEQAVKEMHLLFDEIQGMGRPYFQVIDDIDRRLFQRGMLGFQPREFEAAQAWMLYQRGWGKERIREAVSEIGRYGLGRTSLEKSVNFIFFPFSFSKKYLSTVADFLLQAPARNLLVYEGLKRFEESGLDEKVGEFLEQNVPILQQLWRVNNLAFGLSPGRFFLEGLLDNRTVAAKVAQVMASVMVPSGAATPIAQFAGGATDYAINAFTPIVTTGESIDAIGGVEDFDDLISRYVPFTRDLNALWSGDPSDPGSLEQQLTVLTEGSAPWSQFTEYNQQRRDAKARYSGLATALGYSSVDGFLQSESGVGAKAELDRLQSELQVEYPTGFKMSQTFENRVALNEDALLELASRPEHNAAEEAILRMVGVVEQTESLFRDYLRMPSEVTDSVVQRRIRTLAREHFDDVRFRQLYDRFFAYEYGPIEVTA